MHCPWTLDKLRDNLRGTVHERERAPGIRNFNVGTKWHLPIGGGTSSRRFPDSCPSNWQIPAHNPILVMHLVNE